MSATGAAGYCGRCSVVSRNIVRHRTSVKHVRVMSAIAPVAPGTSHIYRRDRSGAFTREAEERYYADLDATAFETATSYPPVGPAPLIGDKP